MALDETFQQRQDRVAKPQGDGGPVQNDMTTNSAPAPATTPQGRQKQIADYWKTATGRDATQQEYSQWGNNIDDQYYNKITGAIDQTDEAKKYKESQTNPRTADVPAATTNTSDAAPIPQSPVSSTGKIPEPVPGAPVSAAPTATAAPPQAVAQGRNIDMSKVSDMPTYDAQHFNNTLAAAPDQPGAYAGSTISQFNAPDQSGLNNQQNSVLNSVMSNPEVLNMQAIAQMKEGQKEQALLMAQQQKGQYAQGAVARGTLGSGQSDAFRGQTDANTQNNVLTGNRNIDMQAAQTNRDNQLKALQASSGIGQDQMGRAVQGYGATLAGNTAQSADAQAANQSAMQRWLAGDQSALSHATFGHGVDVDNATQQYQAYQSKAEASRDMYARALSAAQNGQANFGQDLQAEFGRGAANLSRDQFGQNNFQFDQQNQNWLKQFMENQRQFNSNTGFNYDQLNSNNAFRGANL